MNAQNDYYRFDDDGRAVVFKRHDVPYPWINYLSNGTLHAFVSQAGGGMCWWKSPMHCRITRYTRHGLPLDAPGFYIYIRQADGTTWSPSIRPCDTKLDAWECRHMPGITEFRARKGALEAVLSLFVAPDEDTLVWDLQLTNHAGAPENVDVFAYVELSQLRYMNEVGTGYYQKWAVKTRHDQAMDALLYINYFRSIPPDFDTPLVYFAATRPSASHAGNRDTFVGNYRDARNPIAVEHGRCDNASMNGGEGCLALQAKLSLPTGATEGISFFLGATPGVLQNYDASLADTSATLERLRQPGFAAQQAAKTRAWWREHLDVFDCTIPDPDAARQINTWNPVQCVHTGRYSRSVSQSASGIRGVGFRDTAQDMLAIAYRKPAWARRMLLYLCSQQLTEGHAAHQSYPDRNAPSESSVRSDNHLWLPLLVHAVASETGDLALLDEEVPFLADDYTSATDRATVWEHLMRGMDFTEAHLGSHGLPLILRSDWNDHFGMFGRDGRGETLFAAEQYVCAMRRMLELAQARGDYAGEEKLAGLIEKQCQAINACAWNGAWWVRGFDDNGRPVGVPDAQYGRIWLNSQSWAVLGRVSEEDRLITAMDAVRTHLDADYGLRIFAPGFPTYPEVSDPLVKWLAPGCAENAGIFCHANTWAIIAEAMLGRAENAWKYYRQLIPHVALQTIGMERYTAEPYAYVSTIFAPEHEHWGWANVNQVTGTAAWMDVAATQYLLGIRPAPGGLYIDPCIPSDWQGFTVTRVFRDCRLNIDVRNPHGRTTGVSAVTVDGMELDVSGGPLVSADVIADKPGITVVVTM